MNNISGYIISESNNFQTPNIIGENKETGRVIIQVTLQDADVVNRNKRVYPKSVLENAIKSEYVQERLATKSWYGEAGK